MIYTLVFSSFFLSFDFREVSIISPIILPLGIKISCFSSIDLNLVYMTVISVTFPVCPAMVTRSQYLNGLEIARKIPATAWLSTFWVANPITSPENDPTVNADEGLMPNIVPNKAISRAIPAIFTIVLVTEAVE
jgi:hypothetical protein